MTFSRSTRAPRVAAQVLLCVVRSSVRKFVLLIPLFAFIGAYVPIPRAFLSRRTHLALAQSWDRDAGYRTAALVLLCMHESSQLAELQVAAAAAVAATTPFGSGLRRRARPGVPCGSAISCLVGAQGCDMSLPTLREALENYIKTGADLPRLRGAFLGPKNLLRGHSFSWPGGGRSGSPPTHRPSSRSPLFVGWRPGGVSQARAT